MKAFKEIISDIMLVLLMLFTLPLLLFFWAGRNVEKRWKRDQSKPPFL